MQPDTFRQWLRERGCSFDDHPRDRGGGHTMVTVRRGSRQADLPMASTRQDLDPDVVHRIVDELGLDANELPGPQSRV